MTDAYGSHLLRLLLNILAGNALSNADAGGSSKGNNSFIRSKASKKFNDDATLALERAWMTQTRQVPPSFTAKLAEIVSELTAELSDADVRVLALHAIASPVLQALLVLHAADTPVADALIDRVLLGIASPAAVDGRLEQERAQWADILLKSQVGSHLFEKILQVASPAMFMRVFNTCFKDKTAQLARHCIGNYTVQSMLDEVKNKEQAQAVLEELMADVKHLVLRGRSGVVHKMLVVAGRFESKQGELMKVVFAALGF